MKILVIGAAGETGEQVVGQAVERGHTVTAFVHHQDKYEGPASVRVVAGDVLDPVAVQNATAEQDAVIDCLGGHTPWKDTHLESNAAHIIIEAMKMHVVKRLLVVSAIGVGETKALVPGWYEKLIMPTLLRGTMQDKAAMEPEVEESGLEWTLVRPGHLVGGERTGKVQLFEPGPGVTAHKITRADLAAFMLTALEEGRYIREAINIASN